MNQTNPSNRPERLPATPEELKKHLPPVEVDPTRQSIPGITDKIDDLRELVKNLEVDPDLKTFINSELDELKSNAATIHLHDIERPGGGFDLHLSIIPVHLGAKVPIPVTRGAAKA